MVTKLSRRDFKKQYITYSQGLFVLKSEKQLPLGQNELNIGKSLSSELCYLSAEERKMHVQQLLQCMLEIYDDVTFTHIEVLFTPSLEQDPLRLLLSFCRNRKICVVWPGSILENKFCYASPDIPEFYEAEFSSFIDTYLITD